MNDPRDEFRLLRTAGKDAFYLNENCFSLTWLDMIVETECGRCSLCHGVCFLHEGLGALDSLGLQQLHLPREYRTRSACVVEKQLNDFLGPLGARPITLEFSGHAKPRNRLGPRGHKAGDCHVVCLSRDA